MTAVAQLLKRLEQARNDITAPYITRVATTKKTHGKDFYNRIGAKGGATKSSKPKGFAAMTPEQRKAAGSTGGKLSRRTTR